MPTNNFKKKLGSGQTQFGLWCSFPSSFATEVVAGAGYDWLLFDTEHSPGDPITVLPQLQAAAAYPDVSALVRPASNDPVLIKRFLDIGAQTLLVPFVQTVDETELAVQASRYAPNGFRGVSALTRATRFGREKGYFDRASDDICIIVQIETQAGLDSLDAIARVDGVDAVFVGPADLAASLGYGSEQTHPDMQATIIDTLKRIRAAGKPAGVLTGDPVLQKSAVEVGVDFMGVGVDVGLLARGAEALLEKSKSL
ncbi:4-hydroxy-2-oxo-heptane-1,7-dioate aldolase (plasmid) [Agrobacterium tumefaciens]|uniref:4-hydroxy-2-oxo-heptane-1,7-dioate aldolase n=1 Tax=Agrobacterium tumefaciens TaxID=358 RepID=A0AAP9J9M7_AGRTU|nr:aldolase/citrate lyase family protein [Agrobacterium tumefaciens]NSZ61163.1 4-hydroxy-2-oxo-heptane-1,7-dioate aldolase [Agrobacterium tumefaciens]QDY97576.1 4-hydroxy-2-oxo-heptane-1,7-dioate aldolase [Agrobacterium tumefaciens]UXS12703.1 4-hydroxy-2-oxo-heptane-1,7-dioate aldolase [Agrobacterium tumefaciens]UXS20065.1 4-hydroxy-2-oxo-heptane-1,7-dioate aldolase [Agrobacterium tumefaciens]UXS27713.1 4-hydroxy-2-oxo-heptane-1,7-dioate aldolase [Agrobacterium tumefaciens]